ncbi:MAG: tetratricopeptide repeat protein [Acidobacteria bacterium]|nr:tetratricopeptide repeat protein [Acidobacteriota bacterium]
MRTHSRSGFNLEILVLLFVLLCLQGANAQAPAAQAQAQTPAHQAYAEANEAYAKLENDKALAAYELAIKLEPNNPDFHLGRARALARLARHTESVEECTAALRLKPDNPVALRDRGHYYINLHRVADAIPDLKRAEQLEKKDREIYYHLGLAYYIHRDFRHAVTAWQGCLALAGKDDDVISCSAWLYPSLVRAGGHEAEAKKVLDRITPEMKPKENTAYFDRLMLFKGAALEEEVAKTMSAGGVATPTVGYSIGLWHLLNGRHSRAKEYFEKAATAEIKYAFGAVAAKAELERLKHLP